MLWRCTPHNLFVLYPLTPREHIAGSYMKRNLNNVKCIARKSCKIVCDVASKSILPCNITVAQAFGSDLYYGMDLS